MARSGYKLYKRKNSPYWWVRFTVPGHPKPYRLSTEVALGSRTEAEGKAARLLVERFSADPSAVIPAAIQALNLNELSELWIEQLERDGRGKKHTDRVSSDLTEHIEKRWQRVEQITSVSWQAWTYDPETRAAGELHHSRGGSLKWRSIAHLANTLRHFLRFCKRKGALATVLEIASPPMKLQEADRSPRGAMDVEKRERFLTALKELGEAFAWRVYTVAFETWMRKGSIEVMNLRWVNWQAETITMPAACNKSRKEKVIDLTPRAAAAIKEQLAANAAAREEGAPVPLDEPIFGPYDFHQAKTQVVELKDGTRKRTPAGGVFGRALRKAGIDEHGLTAHHSTRHSAMTIAGQNPEATLSGMMAQAGIDSAHIIEKHYLHPTLNDARRITREPSSTRAGTPVRPKK